MPVFSWIFPLFAAATFAQTPSSAPVFAPVMSSASLHVLPPAAPPMASTPAISIVYPSEGQVLPATPGTRVMGAVIDPKAPFLVNGNPIKAYHTGAFMIYIPIATGTNTVHFELGLAASTATLTRTFFVPQPPQPLPLTGSRIDPDSVQPAEDQEWRAGDWIFAQARATPGSQLEFEIRGLKKHLPMVEVSSGSSVYQGSYLIQPGDQVDGAQIRYSLKNSNGSDRATAKGRVTIRTDTPLVVVVKSTGAVVVKSAPAQGYVFFPGAKTKFLATGRRGDDIRVRYSDAISGWISNSSIRTLPAGTPPPHSTLGQMHTTSSGSVTSVFFEMSDTVPFNIEPSQDQHTLLVRFYYTNHYTKWVIYDSADTLVRDVRVKQEATDVATVKIDLGEKTFWGYGASWEKNALRVDITHPPAIAQSPLKGRRIVLDPGHMPSAPGAFGPRGVLEKDVNLAIAKALEKMLAERGAIAIMTRPGDDEVSLNDRPKIAVDKKGDLFVSIHNNSFPDGVNPFEGPHGFSVFYYQAHSLELAKAMFRSYKRNSPLPDEQLRFGNLLVARFTEMPAILVESAYMVFPEQEELLTSPAFQKRMALALMEGIRDFLESKRPRAQSSAGPAKARTPREKQR